MVAVTACFLNTGSQFHVTELMKTFVTNTTAIRASEHRTPGQRFGDLNQYQYFLKDFGQQEQ